MTNNLHQAIHFIPHFLFSRRNGHGAHSPFLYSLCEEVFYNDSGFYAFSRLSRIRKELLNSKESVIVEDLGAGSRAFRGPSRLVSDIAAKGISTTEQSQILYRLINVLRCKTCVELGSSLGMNTLYMAAVSNNVNVVSIEGSVALYDFARQLAGRNGFKNAEFIHGNFDDAFPKVLQKIERLDLLYIDGNHRYEPTLRYFEAALQKKHNDTVFVLDDIYWSTEMTKAWKKICEHPDVTLCVDCFYTGYVFFKKEIREKVYSRIYLPR